MKKASYFLTLVGGLLLCLPFASPLPAQQAPPDQTGTTTQHQRDPLVFLRHALGEAGAAALTSTQEQQLQSLITTFRSNEPKPAQDTTLINARNAYEAAILKGDLNAANSAVTAISGEISKMATARMQAQAQFEIAALKVLTPDQVNALQNRIGTSGLIGVLRSMTGGYGMFMRGGRGMMGGGPGMMGPHPH